MKSFIYDLNYDYIKQNGHYLLVFREGDQKQLIADDLAPIQVKMMGSTSIPYLLPLEVVELDLHVRLHYEITSKRMLSHYLKENPLSMEDFYTVLIQIISVLQDSPTYMLEQNKYMLHGDFIFVGKDLQDLYLAYLPIKEVGDKGELVDELRELTLYLASEVTELDGNEFKDLLRSFRDTTFNLVSFKKTLLDLRTRRLDEVNTYSGYETIAPTEPTSHPIQLFESEIMGTFNKEHSLLDGEQEEVDEEPVKRERKPLTERQRVFLFGGAALVIAFIWKLYLDSPAQYMLFIGLGLTVSVLGVVFALLFGWQPSLKGVKPKLKKRKRKKSIIQQDIVPNEVDASIEKVHPLYTHAVALKRPQGNMAMGSPRKNLNEGYYESLNAHTTFLTGTDDTVLLSEDMHNMDSRLGEGKSSAFLLVDRFGKTERIKIDHDHFIIGRNADGVQYFEDSMGVSRMHIEIVTIDDAFGIKDLGSKNGTWLNGQQLVPYKTYGLNDQDVIKLGNVSYTFQMGL